jgi:3D (Asp-Asp-Asp) domain-containing protein
VVFDKMAKRSSRKIDIYMGEDLERALRWGRRKVTIHWSTD